VRPVSCSADAHIDPCQEIPLERTGAMPIDLEATRETYNSKTTSITDRSSELCISYPLHPSLYDRD
jgi:hypothetical protein